MKHQYYKQASMTWLESLLHKAKMFFPPKGTTIGPIPYIEVKGGPNRKERRKLKAVWRRYGELAEKIAKRRGIKIDAALKIAMEAKR